MASLLQHTAVLHRRRCFLPLRAAPASPLQCVRLRNAATVTLRRPARGSRLVTSAERQTETEKKPSQQPPSTVTTELQQKSEEDSWGLFDGKAYLEGWQVPWGGKELALGMVGWATSFVLVGLALIPVANLVAGPQGVSGLSADGKAFLTLGNQVAETVVGVAVVRWAVRSFQPLEGDLFKVDLREPFKKRTGWLVWAGLGVTLSPLVVYLTSLAVDSLGYDGVSGRGTVDSVSSIISLDGPTYFALFSTTAVLAPILEETVFRGLLLATLTKWMPVPAAVLLSAAAFGTAHFTPRDFPQLTALGVLLGLSYVRSRNLLTPMIIHGAWNGTVLTILYMLTAMGVDINSLIHGEL